MDWRRRVARWRLQRLRVSSSPSLPPGCRRFPIHEREVIARAAFARHPAERNAAPGGKIHFGVVLNNPSRREKLRVNLVARSLFGLHALAWCGQPDMEQRGNKPSGMVNFRQFRRDLQLHSGCTGLNRRKGHFDRNQDPPRHEIIGALVRRRPYSVGTTLYDDSGGGFVRRGD
jgi:hypothetical protein